MKTQIIQLEAHDDINSARDKMAWGKASRLLLVWPKRGDILTRRLDLILLQRFSQHLGAQMALVTFDDEIDGHAFDLGIPVFSNINQAQQKSWRRGRGHKKVFLRDSYDHPDLELMRLQVRPEGKPEIRNNRIRILAFLVGISAVLFVIGLFIPGASLTIFLSEKDQSLNMEVWTNPDLQTTTLTGGIPSKKIVIDVEAEAEIQSSSSQQIPDQPAKGTVRIENLTGEQVSIPIGTIVTTLTDPQIRFQTTQNQIIPPNPGQFADVPVQAVLPGSQGNTAAGLVKGVEGSLGLFVSVNNPDQLVGGSDYFVPMPSEDDYQKLRNRLQVTMQKTASTQFAEMVLSPDLHIIDHSIAESRLLNEIREPLEGKPGDRLRLKLRIEYSARTFSDNDLTEVVKKALDANLPQGMTDVPSTLSITSLGVPSGVGENARWNIQALRKIRPLLVTESLPAQIVGRKSADAARIIKDNLQLDILPQIKITPDWWPYLPWLTFRIQVNEQ